MGCNNPLHAFDTGFKTELGKPLYKITGKEIDWIYKPRTEIRALSQHPHDVYHDWKIKDFIEIPCGKCIGCRLKYSREWANRCVLEAKEWEHNYFITLTYAPEHIPVNKETGLVNLKPKDLQDFMKRLRTHYQRKYGHDNVRFYACGEYGSKTSRPHYHILAFNLPIFDLEFLKSTKLGDKLYISDTIDEVWGKGNTWVGEVNWNTCAYVARYIMKKQKGKGAQEYYDELGIEPEFVRMSRKPGIAHDYYEKHKEDIYKYDEIAIKKRSKRKDMEYITERIKPSRYYDKLYDLEDHEFMELLKKRRKASAKAQQDVMMARTSLSRNDYLEQQENRLKTSIKALVRDIE